MIRIRGTTHQPLCAPMPSPIAPGSTHTFTVTTGAALAGTVWPVDGIQHGHGLVLTRARGGTCEPRLGGCIPVDGAGRFAAGDLAAGTWELRVCLAGYDGCGGTGACDAGDVVLAEVDLVAGRTTTLRLDGGPVRPGRICGSARIAGTTLAQYTVACTGPIGRQRYAGYRAEVRPDAAGRFDSGRLIPGRYQLQFASPDEEWLWPALIDVHGGETIDQEFALRQTTLRVRLLVAETRQPVAQLGFALSADERALNYHVSGATDAQGEATLCPAPPMSAHLWIRDTLLGAVPWTGTRVPTCVEVLVPAAVLASARATR